MRVFNSTVIPTLLYGAETWTYLQSDLRSMEVFQMRCLRTILGVSLLQQLRNEAIRSTCCHQLTIETTIRRTRLRWFGHVARMDMERLPKSILCTKRPPTWRVSRTASRLSWTTLLEKDFARGDVYSTRQHAALDIAREMAQNRKQWRSFIRGFAHLPAPALSRR